MPSISFFPTAGRKQGKSLSGLVGKPACVLAPPTLGRTGRAVLGRWVLCHELS